MEYITLGRTGLSVSIMGVGCGGPSKLGNNTHKQEDTSISIIHQALDAGINFIDTAECYGTEPLVGKALQDIDRSSIVISTKKTTWGDEPVTAETLRASLEQSLRNLKTDYIDIYNLHGVPPEMYPELRDEILPVLQQLQQEGKIRFTGITEMFGRDTEHIMLQQALKDNHWDVIMVGFNLLNQTARETVFPAAIKNDVGVQIMFAVRRALSRPQRLVETVNELIDAGEIDPADIDDRNNPLGFIENTCATTTIQDAAYRFARDEPGTHVILSGTGNPDHLKANIRSLEAPPLPDEMSEALRFLFRNVKSTAGN